MRWLLLFAFLLPVAGLAQAPAVNQEYADRQLADPAQEKAASDLMFELRCVQCQGQSIADSDAPIAAAMRHEVRARIQAGATPDQIRGFFISRYGDYISFEPPTRGGALLLWLAPLLILAIAALIASRLFRRGKP
ncbi:MAG: cytochrome c-type biogenesis protein [Sphingorhabdus sp.]